jgi:7-cyano-7-deazaguanine synthase in queuosine biosynthesis
MSAHRLRLSAGANQLKTLSTSDFLWRPRGELSSMETAISPRLEELGPVPPLHVDFVRLAVTTFLADRCSLRNRGTGVRWDRELDLTVPVSDPDLWNGAADKLAEHLHLLTGDWWTLQFEKGRAPKNGKVAQVDAVEIVCLFSGGADSMAGAIAAQQRLGVPPVLVSHWDFSQVAGVQNDLVRQLATLWGDGVEHHSIELMRRGRQVGSGLEFPDEKSRRSRSLLFLALGLAVAATRGGAEVWMSENGFTSINPPLSPERRGSLTTRTTHPAFLDGLSETLRALGLRVRLVNPFETKTKGQVLAEAAAALPDGAASTLFSASHSCGKPAWFKGYSLGQHCGVCYGCLVRRGSFDAAGIDDSTLYIEADLRGTNRHDDFLLGHGRRKTVDAVRYRLRRGYDERDILTMSLPPRIAVADALALVQAGLDELKPVVDAIP